MVFLNAPLVLDARSISSLTINWPKPLDIAMGKGDVWSNILKEELSHQAENSQFYKLSKHWHNAQRMKEQAMLSNPRLLRIAIGGRETAKVTVK